MPGMVADPVCGLNCIGLLCSHALRERVNAMLIDASDPTLVMVDIWQDLRKLYWEFDLLSGIPETLRVGTPRSNSPNRQSGVGNFRPELAIGRGRLVYIWARAGDLPSGR